MKYNSYTVCEWKHGVSISSPMSCELLCGLFKIYKKIYGYDIIDGLISNHLNCAAVLTTQGESKLWRKELGLE